MRHHRRLRRTYTPKQEHASMCLDKAEMWLNVVAAGIAEALKQSRYCGDVRRVVDIVNTDLVAALDRMDIATKTHEEAFGNRRRITTKTKRPPRKKKEQPA
jgi:hypothetical protein